jgi:hypothetical protein
MSLTITVEDPLASNLQSSAAEHRMSPEQFALEVLGQAVQNQKWSLANRRRLRLIEKQFASSLTAEEAAELHELQRQADQQLEALDAQLLEGVSQIRKAVTEALNGSTS